MSRSEGIDRVLIVGGGAAGLSAAGGLAKHGILATVVDKDDCIGSSWARRYQSLKLHTVRRYSGLAHYPIPADRPRYLSKDEYAAYLREYARVLGLRVSLGERVQTVRRSPGDSQGVVWDVETDHGLRRAKVVIVATGHYAVPYLPRWFGSEAFRGTLLHSSGYTTGTDYQGRHVLVVGLGNSGAEIAADLCAQGAASVSVSVRTPPPIVTRELFGVIPVQLLGIALTPLGMPQLIDRIGAVLRRRSIGDLAPYGLAPAAWGPFTARKPAVIDAGFVKYLKQRQITVRPEIDRLETSGVVYEDGSRESVDVIIAATGFRTGLEEILDVPGVIDENGRPRFRSGHVASVPGLYFIGFDETMRGHLFEIGRDSKRLAVEVARYLTGRRSTNSRLA